MNAAKGLLPLSVCHKNKTYMTIIFFRGEEGVADSHKRIIIVKVNKTK